MIHVPQKFERYRVANGPWASTVTDGTNGGFIIPHFRIRNYVLIVLMGTSMGWEHVSVSVAPNGKEQSRCPTWDEMCWVKAQFWDEEDCVVQYHPAKSEYVNMHKYVLHLWRPLESVMPIPNKLMVGI